MSMQHDIRIEKITLNIGAGKEVARLDKAFALLTQLTQAKPVKTATKKRIPTWGLRPGLPIGTKVTLRKQRAVEILKALLHAKDHKLNIKNFDESGNLSFGIRDYIDIDGAKYTPEIGTMGLEVAITLEKPGWRVKKRKLQTSQIGKRQLITKQEAIDFVTKQFNVTILEGKQ